MSVKETLRCRAYQALYRPRRAPREPAVQDGPGAMYVIPQLLRTERIPKPMLVTGPEAGPWKDRLAQALEENDIPFAVWSCDTGVPSVRDGEALYLAWVGAECGSFIALGGPGILDLTKLAAARAVSGRTILEMIGRGAVGRRTPPVMAVPTVTGAGAETLARADIGDGKGNRCRLTDRALVPAFAVLDPALQAEAARPALAAAVMNGLCLAVEAYLSLYADGQLRRMAADALRGYLEAAEPCWNSGGSASQRARLLEASRLAGLAASTAGGGYVRALAEAAEALAHIPFENACAALLPAVLRRYGEAAVRELAALASQAGVRDEGTQAVRAAALMDRLRGMAFCMGLPEALEPMEEETAAQAAEMAAAGANPRWACPVVWTAGDCKRALRAAENKERKGTI